MERAMLLMLLMPALAAAEDPPAAPKARDGRTIAEIACTTPPPPRPTAAANAAPSEIVVSGSRKIRNPDRIAYAVPCGNQRVVGIYFSRDSERHGWGANRYTDIQHDAYQDREYAAIHISGGDRECVYDTRVVMIDAAKKKHEYISSFDICRWNFLALYDLVD